MFLFAKLNKIFFGYFYVYTFFHLPKMINFRGDLSNVLATTATLEDRWLMHSLPVVNVGL